MGTNESSGAVGGTTNRGSTARPEASAGPQAGTTEKAAEFVSRAAEGAHDTIDRLAQQAAPVVQQVQQRLEETGDLVQERAGELRELGREWRSRLRSSVREHPLTTLAAAAALGALIARLSR